MLKDGDLTEKNEKAQQKLISKMKLNVELFKKYKALMPDQSIYKFQAKRDAINALYTMINAKIEEAEITHIVKQVQDVVNKSFHPLFLFYNNCTL